MAEPQGVSKADAMAEAYKRGILPPDKAAAFEEAQRRGLIGSPQAGGPELVNEGGAGSQLSGRPLSMSQQLHPSQLAPSSEVSRVGMGLQPFQANNNQPGHYQSGYEGQGWQIVGQDERGGLVLEHPKQGQFRAEPMPDDPLAIMNGDAPRITPEYAFEQLHNDQTAKRADYDRRKHKVDNYSHFDWLKETATPESAVDTAAAMISGANNVLTLGADDELMSAVGNSGYRASQDDLRARKPDAFMGGQAIAGMVPIGAVNQAMQGQNAVRTTAASASVGGLHGGAHGFGDADGSLQDRLRGANEGGAMGAVFGGGLVGGASALPYAKQFAGDFLKTVSPAEARALASQFTSNPQTAKQLRSGSGKFGNTLDAELELTEGRGKQALSVLNRLFKQSGLSPDDILRVSRTVQDSKLNVPNLAAGRQTLAERYLDALRDDFPQAHDNLLLTLREGGMLGGAKNRSASITRNAGNAARESQAPFLEGRAREVFGADSQLSQGDDLALELARIGQEEFRPILARGFDDPAQEQVLQRRLAGPLGREAIQAVRKSAAIEGRDIDQWIKENPADAAHWMQSYARRRADDLQGDPARATERGDWLKIREQLAEPLRAGVPGYRQAQALYADEAAGLQAQSMGKRFLSIAKDETALDQFKRSLDELPENARPLALASVRNAIISKIRAGQEGGAVRFGELGSNGFLNGLETTFGREGKALADDIRALREESRFFNTISPDSNSRTVPNMDAKREGPRLLNNPIANMASDNGGSMATDAMLTFATGSPMAPFSALRLGRGLVRNVAQVKPETRNALSSMMMSRQGADALNAPVPARQLPGPARRGYVPDGNAALNQSGGQSPRMVASDFFDAGDPFHPNNRGQVLPGGMDESGRYQSPDDLAALEARQAVQEVNAKPERRNRFNTSQVARVPDWEGPIPERPVPLTEWIKRQGGIRDEGGEVSNILGGANARPGVISNLERGGRFSVSGRDLDAMTQRAIEDGYLPQGSQQNDLLDLLADDGRNGDVFAQYGSAADSQAANEWNAYADWTRRANVATPYEAAKSGRERRKRGKLLDDPLKQSALPALVTGGSLSALSDENGGGNALADAPMQLPPLSGGGMNALAALMLPGPARLGPAVNALSQLPGQ